MLPSTAFAASVPAVLRGLAAVCLRAACLLAALPAHADTLYHCRDAHGVSVYQNEPCAGALRAVGEREFSHAAIDPALAAQTEAARQALERRRIESMRGARLAAVRQRREPRAEDPCKAAKARRESTLKRVGLKRSYDLLSQLDGDVWDVCKGF